MERMIDRVKDHRPGTTLIWRAATRLLVPAVAVILAVAGLPATNQPAHAGVSGDVVHARDFLFAVSNETVTPGPVHFQLLNDSTTYQHELWIFPTDQPRLQELLAKKQAGDINEEDFLQGLAGHVEDIAPGHSIGFDVSLPEGTYTLACFIKSSVGGTDVIHYNLGMHTTITSTSAASAAAPAAAPTSAPAPAPVPVAPALQPAVVKVPNTGTGPASSDTGTAIALLVLAGAIVVAAGSAVRVGLRRGRA
jgi:uncharacterized cupredoxin-like copper-binding protein